MKNEFNLKSMFFGFNKSLVNDHINSLNKAYEENLEKIHNRIDKSVQEKEKLLLELNKYDTEKRTAMQNKELLEFAQSRLEKTANAIGELASREIEQIMTTAKENVRMHEINNFKTAEKIKEANGDFDILLRNLIQLLEDKQGISEAQIAEAMEPVNINSGNKSKFALYMGKKQNDVSSINESNESNKAIQATKEASEVNEAKKAKANNENNFWGTDEKHITADRTEIFTFKEGSLGSNVNKSPNNSTNSSLNNSSNNTEMNVLPGLTSKAESFSSAGQDLSTFTDSRTWDNSKDDFTSTKVTVTDKSKANSSVDANTNTFYESKQNLDDGFGMSNDKNRKHKEAGVFSPTVTDEINLIRNKYIIGKMAGENIIDSNGRIIISKNEIITSDIVVRADREGKLPDLIISMILPGMES